MQSDKLYRIMGDGRKVEVPRPSSRSETVRTVHEQCGHFGWKRTLHLLLNNYWWYGMYEDVQQLVRNCEVCARVNSSFNSNPPQLMPLSIEGLMYRWGLDIAGPFPPSVNGYNYVLVCIEHFSKWIELIPLKDKSASQVSQAYLMHVLSRFGASAEVLTDQGGEFEGELQALLDKCFIDHRITSAYHPQANGLAERQVQTFKRGLAKMCDAMGKHSNWDELIPWVALGYRCSVQASTGFSPYHLLFGVHPVVPPAVKERVEQPLLDPTTPELQLSVFRELLQRSRLIQENCVTAGHNLRIAQHRDTLRYARRHGQLNTKLFKFAPGDFVYLKRPPNQLTALSIKARPEILRVVERRPSGVLLLQGKCGSTMPVHMSRCAPCHLPDIDPTVDTSLAKPPASLPCDVCGSPEDEQYMMLCDSCNHGWHTYCLNPKLEAIPEGSWVCPRCQMHGITAEHIPEGSGRGLSNIRTPAAIEKHAAHLHNRWVTRGVTVRGQYRTEWGQVEYRGSQHHPKLFVIKWHNAGTSEPLTARQVSKFDLQAPSSNPPEAAGFAAAVVPAAAMAGSTEQVVVWDRDQVEEAASTLMPGAWTRQQISRLYSQLQNAYSNLPRVTTKDEEVARLLEVVDLSAFPCVVDLWSGDNAVQRVLANQGIAVLSNDLSQDSPAALHLDALQVSTYARLRSNGQLDAAVMSPWFGLLDLALPLAAQHVPLVCCHCPGHYVFNAIEPRRLWLQRLARQGRLHLVLGVTRSNMGMKCVWLVIAHTAELLQAVLHGQYTDRLSVSL